MKSSTRTYNKNTINNSKHVSVSKCQYHWYNKMRWLSVARGATAVKTVRTTRSTTTTGIASTGCYATTKPPTPCIICASTRNQVPRHCTITHCSPAPAQGVHGVRPTPIIFTPGFWPSIISGTILMYRLDRLDSSCKWCTPTQTLDIF